MTRSKTATHPVKLATDVFRKVSIIAVARGVAMSDYVSEKLRQVVDADFTEALADLLEEYGFPVPGELEKLRRPHPKKN